MKRCPKCNRTYTTNTQKFCTHDGGILDAVDMGQETIRLDSSQLDDDAPTKVISRELVSETTAEFDPFKTVVSRPEGTVSVGPPDTQDLPSTTLYPPAAQPPAPPAGSGQVSPASPQASAPPPPPPAAAPPPLPTQRLVGSAPLPAPTFAQAPAQPTAPPPVKKKSKLPLVLGILVVLLVLGAGLGVAAYLFGPKIISALQSRRSNPEPSSLPTKEPTPNIETTPDDVGKTNKDVVPEPPPYSPPADAVEFVNSSKNLDGQLAEHYVDFSFYYPNRWQKDPAAGTPGARNFAQVERRLPPDFTQENFAVAWNSSAAPVAENRALFHTLAENLSAQFEKKFPGYRKVSEGETKLGVYDGYEFRFESMSPNTAKGDLKVWGRVIFLAPVDGGKNGVTLLMLATSLAPELKSVDDVGIKGELPMMLASFRFGKK
ncbi:MAG TPA: hypothetical protein VF333_05755 [Pyrinomonadaceae bacterium]|jgi:hypothetical protein